MHTGPRVRKYLGVRGRDARVAAARSPPPFPVPRAGGELLPLARDCHVLALAGECGVGPVPVALAASYLQRLRARALARAAGPDTELERVLASDVFRVLLERPGVFGAPPTAAPGHSHDDQCMLMLAYLMCLHLAVKVVHVPRARYSVNRLAERMLEVTLDSDDLMQLEVMIMRMLDFRLVPLARASAPAAAPTPPPEREMADADDTPSKRAKPDESPTAVLECAELMSP